MNQIKGVVNIAEVKKRAVEHFMFAGEDARLVHKEKERMLTYEGHLCKKICARSWQTCSLLGFCNLQLAWCRFTVYTTLSATDLQQLVIKERAAWKKLVRKVIEQEKKGRKHTAIQWIVTYQQKKTFGSPHRKSLRKTHTDPDCKEPALRHRSKTG